MCILESVTGTSTRRVGGDSGRRGGANPNFLQVISRDSVLLKVRGEGDA